MQFIDYARTEAPGKHGDEDLDLVYRDFPHFFSSSLLKKNIKAAIINRAHIRGQPGILKMKDSFCAFRYSINVYA